MEENSGGRIKVSYIPMHRWVETGDGRSSSIGHPSDGPPDTSITASFEKSFNVVELPYLFTTRESAFERSTGVGQELDKRLLKTGMMNLGYFENGFRHITNNKRPIYSPEDLKGLKIRTMEVPPHIAFFKELGANPLL